MIVPSLRVVSLLIMTQRSFLPKSKPVQSTWQCPQQGHTLSLVELLHSQHQVDMEEPIKKLIIISRSNTNVCTSKNPWLLPLFIIWTVFFTGRYCGAGLKSKRVSLKLQSDFPYCSRMITIIMYTWRYSAEPLVNSWAVSCPLPPH